jgi:sugar phosphate isomerase/epimerase
MTLTRRQFLIRSARVSSVVLCSRFARAEGSAPDVKFPPDVRERIAIASYPFRDFIASGDKNSTTGAKIELKDFAAHVSEKFGIRKIEPWTGHFPSTDLHYLEQFRASLEKAKGFVVNMAVDGEDSPYATDAAERARAVTYSKKWVDVAAFLGAPGIRTNLPQAKDSEPNLERTAESLKRVLEHAAAKNVVINLENDNPVSEDPFFLVQLVQKVDSPWLRTLPDFANSLAHREAEYAYKGFGAMCPHAYSICHVKEVELNDAGRPVEVDMTRAFSLLKQAGFRGYCSMEWDSPGDAYAGTRGLIKKTEKALG